MDRSQPFQPETLDNAHNVMSVFEYLLMLHNDLLDLEVVAAIEAAEHRRQLSIVERRTAASSSAAAAAAAAAAAEATAAATVAI